MVAEPDDGAMLRLAVALFAVQAGFHGFTAALPVALARAGMPDPQIGLIVGTAALIQVPAAFVAGVVIDQVGGLRVFIGGGIAYLIGCAILLLPGVEPGGAVLPFLAARLFQGIGAAAMLPSAMSLVPRLSDPRRRGFALAFMGSAHNLTLVVLPPLSLAVLSASSLHGVAVAVTAFVLAGLALVGFVPFRFRPTSPLDGQSGDVAGGGPATAARRRLGFAFRRSWMPLIAIVLLYIVHWGVLVAYLPQRAEAAGADVGLFFAADGVAILAFRVPSGWLADRVPSARLLTGGLLATGGAIALVVLPPTTTLLIAAGLLSGGGGGLVMTPLLVELSRRADDADRGSAFSLFSAAMAGALVVGSIGAAPVVGRYGFETAMLIALGGVAIAMALAWADGGLRTHPTHSTPAPADAA